MYICTVEMMNDKNVIKAETMAGDGDDLAPQSKEPVELVAKTYASYPLLSNVHLHLASPCSGSTYLTRDDFIYYHYACDGFKDSGWGCAYRTLQSMCSWIVGKSGNMNPQWQVPSIREIQETLTGIGDKPPTFVGSRDWIGAVEVFFVVDTLYDVPCKILHIQKREDLKKYANVLKKYFEDFGGFVMMGGDMDAASKGIAGIHISCNQAYFLVIDPHYQGIPKSVHELIESGYIRWPHTSEFVDSSFYNLCLPQLK